MTGITASTLEGIVVADASVATLVAKYSEAKRQAEDAEERVEALKRSLHAKFDAADARKFADEEGEILIARSEVQTPLRVDIPKLQRIAPAVYADVLMPRGKFFRLTLPRLSRR